MPVRANNEATGNRSPRKTDVIIERVCYDCRCRCAFYLLMIFATPDELTPLFLPVFYAASMPDETMPCYSLSHLFDGFPILMMFASARNARHAIILR